MRSSEQQRAQPETTLPDRPAHPLVHLTADWSFGGGSLAVLESESG